MRGAWPFRIAAVTGVGALAGLAVAIPAVAGRYLLLARLTRPAP
jgi:hypothetical protein